MGSGASKSEAVASIHVLIIGGGYAGMQVVFITIIAVGIIRMTIIITITIIRMTMIIITIIRMTMILTISIIRQQPNLTKEVLASLSSIQKNISTIVLERSELL